MDTSEFLTIELRIQGADIESILARWESGKWLLAKREGKSRLPKGLVSKLTKETGKSERELQFRMKLAEKFPTESDTRSAAAAMEWSWHRMTREALIDAPGSRPRAVPPMPPDVPERTSPRPPMPPEPSPDKGWITRKLVNKSFLTMLNACEKVKDETIPDTEKSALVDKLRRIIKFATFLLNKIEGDDVTISFTDEELEEFRNVS